MIIPRNRSKPLTEVIAPPVEPIPVNLPEGDDAPIPATVVVNQGEPDIDEL